MAALRADRCCTTSTTRCDGRRRATLVLAGARLHGFIGGKRSAITSASTSRPAARSTTAASPTTSRCFRSASRVRFGETSFITLGARRRCERARPARSTMRRRFRSRRRFEVGARPFACSVARARRNLGRGEGAQSGRRARRSPTSSRRMLGVRLGHRYNDYGFPTGNGYFVGRDVPASCSVTRFAGAIIGYSSTWTRRIASVDCAGCDERATNCVARSAEACSTMTA